MKEIRNAFDIEIVFHMNELIIIGNAFQIRKERGEERRKIVYRRIISSICISG